MNAQVVNSTNIILIKKEIELQGTGYAPFWRICPLSNGGFALFYVDLPPRIPYGLELNVDKNHCDVIRQKLACWEPNSLKC